MTNMPPLSDRPCLPLRAGFFLQVQHSVPYAIFRGDALFGETPRASLENYVAHLVAEGRGCGMLKAKLMVTGACNQRCYYCCVASDWDKKGLSLDEVYLILERFAKAGIISLQLHGGDVSVRRDLPAILKRAAKLGMFVDFFTNGSGPVWRSGDIYETILSLPVPPSVTVTFLAGEPNLHDQLAGAKGAFRQAVETILRLKRAGAYVRLSISLTNRSYDQLRAVAALAEALQCRLSVITEVYSSVAGVVDTSSLSTSLDQLLAARRQLLGEASIELEHRSCSAGVVSLTVDHFGNVVGCERNTTNTFGSLLEQDLRTIVESDRYRQYMTQFYRRPAACAKCPAELSRFCDWCPAIPFNFGLEQESWLDFHCAGAMQRRLFWSGRSDPVPGSRAAAQNALQASSSPLQMVARGRSPLVALQAAPPVVHEGPGR